MLSIDIEILGEEMSVDFDYRITYEGDNGSGPDSYYGPEPPSPMEYEITDVWLNKQDYRTQEWNEVDIPEWLKDIIIMYLIDSQNVYDMIREDQEGYM